MSKRDEYRLAITEVVILLAFVYTIFEIPISDAVLLILFILLIIMLILFVLLVRMVFGYGNAKNDDENSDHEG
ncbi:MAG: hypothetical protein KAH86_09465 [Methanosarcinales archaeon]|nr:hypothetical protein [Methanosarcinales archaeon]